MELVDTHCHIHEIVRRVTPVYDKWHEKDEIDVEDVVRAAQENGVIRLVCVGTTLEDSRMAIEFAKDRPNCWTSVGIHPHESASHQSKNKKLQFSHLLEDSLGTDEENASCKIVAVGECGLDYFYEHSPREVQIEVLEFQIELALDHGLPLIFHVRDAFPDFWPIFEKHKGVRGVLHSFTDSAENMQKAIKLGLYIGVNGIVTFTKIPAQLEMYKQIPLQNLLLETDAPFLTPVPYRGTINEPKYVRTITEFLSQLRQESVEEIAKVTTLNAQKLFGLE